MAVTRDIAAAKTKAEAEDYMERLRIQREEGQYAQHKQTQSANIGAFQIEKQTEIGIAGAEALGQMGKNDAGGINLGDNTGFNPAAMMAGMALGGAVGQNIAGTMNGMMSVPVQATTQPEVLPPPIPTVSYYLALNGQASGPFDLSSLTQMISNGVLMMDTLVWKTGMAQWTKAGETSDLKNLFPVMPPIPTEGDHK